MIERQQRVIRQAFGHNAHLVQTGPDGDQSGRVEIHLDGNLLGSGASFPKAVADAMAFSVAGLCRASGLPTI